MSDSEQQSMAARFGALFVPVGAQEMAGVALETLSLEPLNALRHPRQGTSCGWYIWGGEELSQDLTFFKPVHVAHLSEQCPALVPYLGLGPGWRVLLAPNHKDVWFDEKLLAV
ncbi:hypothetical protein BWI17_03880 [Betaproteobacteria bacterium GR16-43]|nr:hypothetical protein BWI17_03880 [Betaproteobacteria bacterium GR16-43]